MFASRLLAIVFAFNWKDIDKDEIVTSTDDVCFGWSGIDTVCDVEVSSYQ